MPTLQLCVLMCGVSLLLVPTFLGTGAGSRGGEEEDIFAPVGLRYTGDTPFRTTRNMHLEKRHFHERLLPVLAGNNPLIHGKECSLQTLRIYITKKY